MKIKNFIPSFNAAMAQDEVKTLNKFFARKLIFIFHQGVSFDSNNEYAYFVSVRLFPQPHRSSVTYPGRLTWKIFYSL